MRWGSRRRVAPTTSWRVPGAAQEAGRTGASRWVAYLEPLPEHLRDDEPAALRRTAMRARSAYGPKDSIREVLGADVTEPFLDAIDRLLRELNRSRG